MPGCLCLVLIVNADDFGRSKVETDLILSCYERKRLTSTTAMVFMEDSARAAELARGSDLDIGLHLNLSQPFTGEVKDRLLREYHARVVRFITSSKFARCTYNPALRRQFRYIYQAQFEEFVRLYGRHPSHIDGHHHTHLCTNMLLDGIIPPSEKVRRSFSFWPGEKSRINRIYRKLIDRSLARKYRITDFFFSLHQCLQGDRVKRVFDLSKASTVELMTHPAAHTEYAYLMSDGYAGMLEKLSLGTYAAL